MSRRSSGLIGRAPSFSRLFLHQRQVELLERERHLADHLDARRGEIEPSGDLAVEKEARAVALALEEAQAFEPRRLAPQPGIEPLIAIDERVHGALRDEPALVDDDVVIGEALEIG